jgi:hypothetical protein
LTLEGQTEIRRGKKYSRDSFLGKFKQKKVVEEREK